MVGGSGLELFLPCIARADLGAAPPLLLEPYTMRAAQSAMIPPRGGHFPRSLIPEALPSCRHYEYSTCAYDR